MRYKLSKFVSIFQGVALATLCFLTSSAFASSYCGNDLQTLVQVCKIVNTPANDAGCESLSFGGFHGYSGSCSSGVERSAFANYIGDEFRIVARSGKWWPDSAYDPANRDPDNCIIVSSFTEPVCEDNPFWQDTDTYDSDGCIGNEGACPGDPGWVDADGYNEAGFDTNGQDRGGNTAAQGGGYTGSAGSGGTPPSYIEPPIPIDPQNGNNRDNNNVLQCYAAYPVTVTKSLLPSSVQDGLSGCSNECVYQPQSTIWDFSAAQEVVQLVPTGAVCQGEPNISVVDIITYTPPPPAQAPAEEYDNLNACYLNGGYFYCDHPLDPTPAECFRNVGGWVGAEICCQDAQDNPETCGYANGVYHCVDSNSNCQSYSGVIHCIDTDGNYVSFSDPDHITNGGNGDGDPTNDVFADVADVTANGQSTQERVTQALDAKEVAREIDRALAGRFSSVVAAIEAGTGDGTDLSELVEGSSGDSLVDSTGFLASIAGVGTDSDLSFDGSIIDPITNLVGGIIPAAGSCQNFTYDFLPSKGYTFNINTCDVSIIQPLLQWLVYVLTLLTLYNLALGNKGENT